MLICKQKIKQKIDDNEEKVFWDEDVELKVLDFYLTPKSMADTAREFNITSYIVKQILDKHDIKLHDKDTTYKLLMSNRIENNLKKYGVEHTTQVEEIKNKIKTSIAKNDITKMLSKMKQTCLDKYGVEYVFQADKIKNKIKQTTINKYGVDNYSQTSEYKEKTKQTNLEKYGVEWFTQTNIYHAKSKKQFVVNNIYFDSFPELCFYLYCINNNINIARANNCFEYIFNNTKHKYMPDFIIDNTEYVEIKGPQFIKNDGTWQNPFDHSLDDLYEAKHQCAINNRVKIILKSDYLKYIQYFNDSQYNIEEFITN